MQPVFDPHHLKRRFESEISKINQLPESNRLLILDFVEKYRFRKKEISIARMSRLAFCLRFFSNLLEKPLKPFRSKEAEELVKAIESYERHKGKKFALHTWRELTKNIKLWIRWVNPKDFLSVWDECRDFLWVQNPYADPKRKANKSEFLVTDELFVKLLHAAQSDQLKAILAVAFGTGARSGELMGVRRKDVSFNEDGTAQLSFFESKTYPRENVLMTPDLAFYVREWFNKSPKRDSNDFLFVKETGEALTENWVNLKLKVLAGRAGLGNWVSSKTSTGRPCRQYVGQRLFLTMFRRAHISFVLKQKMPLALISKRVWGSEHSNQIKIYASLSSDDANEAFRQAMGLEKPKVTEPVLKPRKCFKCGQSFGLETETCPKCNISINPFVVAQKLDKEKTLESRLLAMEEHQKMMQHALEKLVAKL